MKIKFRLFTITMAILLAVGVSVLSTGNAAAAQCPTFYPVTSVKIPGYTWPVNIAVRYYACGGPQYKTISMLISVPSGNSVGGSLTSNDGQKKTCAYSWSCVFDPPAANFSTYNNWLFNVNRGGHGVYVYYTAAGTNAFGYWSIASTY